MRKNGANSSIGRSIYLAFSQVMMNELLRRSIFTDLSVGISNASGVIEFAGRLFRKGIIGQYTAIYFNIHNFRYVNNVLPHLQADEVMKLYANMLLKAVEKGEIVGRLGGDNFISLVRTENVGKFVDFISNMDIIYPYGEDVKKFNFSATIGVGDLDGLQNVGELIARSVLLIRWQGLVRALPLPIIQRKCTDKLPNKETIARFHRAVKQKEFVVYYRRRLLLQTKRFVCRKHWCVEGRRQNYSAGQFIPILEKDGSICKLDFYVLEQVCIF